MMWHPREEEKIMIYEFHRLGFGRGRAERWAIRRRRRNSRPYKKPSSLLTWLGLVAGLLG
jgi:hypothetical protein